MSKTNLWSNEGPSTTPTQEFAFQVPENKENQSPKPSISGAGSCVFGIGILKTVQFKAACSGTESHWDLQQDIALCSTIWGHLRELVSALHVCMDYHNTPTVKGETHSTLPHVTSPLLRIYMNMIKPLTFIICSVVMILKSLWHNKS